jgi:CheY-like chemotaxis protein
MAGQPARGNLEFVARTEAGQQVHEPPVPATGASPPRTHTCVFGSRVLEMAGFTVMTAADGRTAVQIFGTHANEIKAVLLDMTMPHMSGEEVFREMRTIQPGVKVILSSGYNEQETISQFQGKGLAGFIREAALQVEASRALKIHELPDLFEPTSHSMRGQ